MQKMMLFVLAAALLALPAHAEMTLDEVIARHFEALGGADNLKAVESARLTGTMSMGPGGEVPFVMVFARPLSARMEFTMQGMTAVQAYDGETAWMIMPFAGQTEPKVMPLDQAKNMIEQADFDGPLMDWQQKGHQVELLGLEETEGTEVYKLKITLEGGDVRYHYLDSEDFLVIKQEGKATVQGAEMDFETLLSEYKEVEGLMFPHSILSRPKGAPESQVVTIEKVELDVDLPEDYFSMPAPPEGQDAGASG